MFKDVVIHTDLECPIVQVILGHEGDCGIQIKKCSFEEVGFVVLIYCTKTSTDFKLKHLSVVPKHLG